MNSDEAKSILKQGPNEFKIIKVIELNGLKINKLH
jgi:hypothetical protein